MEFDWQTFGYDGAWLETAVQLEQENNWDGEVGAWLAQRQSAAVAIPEQVQVMMQMMRLQSILFTELQAWMSSWNLGVALADALTCARRCVRSHLTTPTLEQQAYFAALLAEDAAKTTKQPMRAQVVEQLKAMLTPQDWQVIAQAAAQAMQTQVMAMEPSQVA